MDLWIHSFQKGHGGQKRNVKCQIWRVWLPISKTYWSKVEDREKQSGMAVNSHAWNRAGETSVTVWQWTVDVLQADASAPNRKNGDERGKSAVWGWMGRETHGKGGKGEQNQWRVQGAGAFGHAHHEWKRRKLTGFESRSGWQGVRRSRKHVWAD